MRLAKGEGRGEIRMITEGGRGKKQSSPPFSLFWIWDQECACGIPSRNVLESRNQRFCQRNKVLQSTVIEAEGLRRLAVPKHFSFSFLPR